MDPQEQPEDLSVSMVDHLQIRQMFNSISFTLDKFSFQFLGIILIVIWFLLKYAQLERSRPYSSPRTSDPSDRPSGTLVLVKKILHVFVMIRGAELWLTFLSF